jgi:transcriptional regulator GlxA family with amidase domain
VFCATDFQARQAIRLCADLGLDVPGQVGVLGIGDRFWDGVAAGMEISSMPIPYRRIGVEAAKTLAARMKDGHPVCIRMSPGEIRARESTRLPGSGNDLLERVHEGWASALADPAPVSEVARREGMSRRKFERAFTAQAGTTPYEYLLRLRTDRAVQLLQETDWSVTRIGSELGIPDPARFSAFVKKRTGKAPSRWRGA